MNYKYPFNIVFIFIPVLALILLILAYRKKEKILNAMNIKTISRFKILKHTYYTRAYSGCLLLMGPQTFQDFGTKKRVLTYMF